MDAFKELLNKMCGVGGVRCHCCNPTSKHKRKGKSKRDKPLLDRRARRMLKQELRKELDY